MTAPVTRKIIHIDMDAFYASVEMRDNPSLKGKPVIVGGSPDSRGVVAAASYEARKFGVRSAISSAEARRRCPQAVFIRPRFEAYSAVSEQVMEILKTVTDQIEPLSLDEAYLDVTTNKLGQPSATRLAEHLRREIFARTQLTASAGVSYNKFLAKIASDLNKPNGLCVITPADVDRILMPLPVGRLWGVGKVTEKTLKSAGYQVIADLRAAAQLEALLGSMGPWLWELAHGRDDREVDATWDPKSSGTEETFSEDILSVARLLDELEPLCDEVSESLKAHQWFAITFTLKVKYHDFKQITRSVTLTVPTDSKAIIFQNMKKLLQDKTEAGTTPIRLLGVSASGLIRENDPLQLYFSFMDQV
jgi:DNA polymerase-4